MSDIEKEIQRERERDLIFKDTLLKTFHIYVQLHYCVFHNNHCANANFSEITEQTTSS